MPRGAIIDGKLDEILPVDLKDPAQVQEFVNHSWYQCADETARACTPSTASPSPTSCSATSTKGTRTDIKDIDESAKYSWIKSPRWRGHAMEVGPLARYVIGYAIGPARVCKEPVDNGAEDGCDVHAAALFATLGRTAARGLEASWAAAEMRYFFDKLMANLKAGEPRHRQHRQLGARAPGRRRPRAPGYCEAPRGALGHWIKIKDTKIDDYQCVVPTTWNASPRDAKGQIGAFEASLMNTAGSAEPDQPLEILRTIHSFDPVPGLLPRT